jgi:hypothetical protein
MSGLLGIIASGGRHHYGNPNQFGGCLQAEAASSFPIIVETQLQRRRKTSGPRLQDTP